MFPLVLPQLVWSSLLYKLTAVVSDVFGPPEGRRGGHV